MEEKLENSTLEEKFVDENDLKIDSQQLKTKINVKPNTDEILINSIIQSTQISKTKRLLSSTKVNVFILIIGLLIFIALGILLSIFVFNDSKVKSKCLFITKYRMHCIAI